MKRPPIRWMYNLTYGRFFLIENHVFRKKNDGVL